jgi:DNA-binding SARP family transcriptional activator
MSASEPLTIRLFGPLQILRAGRPLLVPASRKARAILGYLVMSRRPVSRQRLCDLFFDLPDDPRASLRWTLTKLRAVVDDPDTPRIQSSRDTLSFEPAGASVDALEVTHGRAEEALPDMAGAFLEDAELPERQDFMLWLQATREELRSAGAARLRDALTDLGASADRRLALARQLQALEPTEEFAHVTAVQALVQLGRSDAAREAANDAERVLRRAGKTAPAALRAALAPRLETKPAPAAQASDARPQNAPQIFDMLPCVAIMPFHNYSPEVISDDLMDGLLESVIHMFSRFRMFRVLSLSSSLAMKGRMHAPDALRAETGAHYIIGGSLLAKGDTTKLRYRIVDAATGALLSSGDVLGPAASAKAMLDELPTEIVPYLVHQCQELVRSRAVATPEPRRTAVDHYQCGVNDAYYLPSPNFPRALASLEAALAVRPDFAAAMAAAAHCKAMLGVATAEPARTQARELALAAITLGNDDAFALALGAWSLVQIAEDVEPALRATDLAIRVNPLARIGWSVSAWIRAMNGEYETPMAHWEEAEKCSPLGASFDLINSGRALCCWMAGHYAQSLAWAKRSLERAPSNPGALTAGVAAAVMLDDREALREMAARLLQHYAEGADSSVIARSPIMRQDKREAILAATRRGLEMARQQQQPS